MRYRDLGVWGFGLRGQGFWGLEFRVSTNTRVPHTILRIGVRGFGLTGEGFGGFGL